MVTAQVGTKLVGVLDSSGNRINPAKQISKTQSSVLALQKVTVAPRQVISNAIDVSNVEFATIFYRMGRQTETAFSAGVDIFISAAVTVGGNNYWHPVTQVSTRVGANVGSESPTGATAAGQKTILVASTTNLVAGDEIFIEHTTLANSEFGKIAIVNTNTSIVLEENLLFAHDATSIIYSQAERNSLEIDCRSLDLLRVKVDGRAAAQNYVIDAYAILGA